MLNGRPMHQNDYTTYRAVFTCLNFEFTFIEVQAEKAEKLKDKESENKISPILLAMQPILRFLQLLCENHNYELQVSLLFFQIFKTKCCGNIKIYFISYFVLELSTASE